eukprot:8359016-Pyramimonas_sp.AAC.1
MLQTVRHKVRMRVKPDAPTAEDANAARGAIQRGGVRKAELRPSACCLRCPVSGFQPELSVDLVLLDQQRISGGL